MKLLYTIVLFITIFYGVTIMINALGIFPETAFDTAMTGEDPYTIIGYIFTPSIRIGTWTLNVATGAAITAFIIALSIGTGILTQNPTIPSVAIVGYMFFNAMTKGYGFMKVLFTQEGSPNSVIYLGVCIGAAIIVIGFITIVEMMAQGRSGGD